MNFYQNSLKLLLLLHFSMDSFETRYTYFLGQSPNFVLFRILKFGFSDFLWTFIKFSLKSLLLLQFPMDSFESRYTCSLGQSSHLPFRFLKFVFFYFLGEFSSNFHSNRTAPTIFNIWIPLKLGTEIRYWLADFEIICRFWMFHIRIAATA